MFTDFVFFTTTRKRLDTLKPAIEKAGINPKILLIEDYEQVDDAGMKAGVTLNPSTPVSVLEDIIKDVDMVLLMSVNPGFGGQKFIENTIDKVKRLRKLIEEKGANTLIEVDGGVQGETAPRLVAAGVDVLVSGSYIFKSATPEAIIHSLREL